MRKDTPDVARRAFLATGARTAGLAMLTIAIGRSGPAAAKAAKGDFQYQDHQRDGKRCGLCKFYLPSAPDADTGGCAIVEGAVRRDGWCLAFVPAVSA